ncbi:Transcriptional regulator, TetR family [uncultured Paludibacter sp.]|nr:Transcriptional regulator, TetR family [uncultured Paludibacter sp.]
MDTKEYILIEAAKLFLQKSFKEVTTREIVVATGLSKGAFYYHFESKEQLFREVLMYIATNVYAYHYDEYDQNSFQGFYRDYANEAIKNTGNFLKILNSTQKEEELFINFFNLFFDALRLIPEFKHQVIPQLEKELNIWKESIKKARERNEIKSKMTDEQIARLFINLGDGVSLHFIFISNGSLTDTINYFVELWDGIYELIKN